MDYKEGPGWEPRVTKVFRKIMSSVSIGLSWMIAVATAGLYFGLAYFDGPAWQSILFFAIAGISFYFLLRFLYKTWKDEF